MRAAAFWHNKVPRQLRFWGSIHLLFRALLIAAAPATAAYTASIDWTQAAVIAGALLFLNIGTTVADRLSKARKRPPDFTAEGLVRVGDLLSALKPSAPKVGEDREAVMAACLGIIENIALPIAKAQKGELSANLILYVGNSTTRMRVRARNPGNTRPAGRDFPAERILGHHVCQRGDTPLVINHIKHFGKDFAASPTQTSYAYKAILLLPLVCDSPTGQQVRGFVSIDCNRPYAFYGNRSIEIAVMCRPILAQLREIIRREN